MNLWYELTYTLRTLRKKLGFSALCIIVIAMGYAITMPIYSVVKNFAYTTLSFTDGDRLIFIRQTNIASGREYDSNSFDFFQYNIISSGSSSFDSIEAYRNTRTTLSDGEYAQRFNGVQITAGGFGLSSIPPQLGRPLQSADELPGADPVTVISHFVWQNYYGGVPDIVGQESRVNGEFRTIVGVMPPGYSYPDVAEVWVPLSIDRAAEPGGPNRIAMIGMLVDGVSRQEATAELATTMQRLRSEHEAYEDRSVKVTPYTHGFISNALALFNSIGGLGVCILILICLNVGNLLLIRTNERIAELAIRNALGASRSSLVAHVLLESLLVCFLGATLGLLLSSFILEYIQFLFFEILIGTREIPFWFDFSLNTGGVMFGLGMMIFIWLASGIFAGWRAIRHDVSTILGGHSKSSGLKENGKINRFLVHLQITLSFFLLVVSGCYLFALQNEFDEAIVPDSDRIVRAAIDLNYPRYESTEARYLYSQELRSQLSNVPEIESISLGSAAPGYISGIVSVVRDDVVLNTSREQRSYGLSSVDTDYFQNLGVELLQGRHFESLDSANSDAVAIVSERFLQSEQLEDSPIGEIMELQPVYGDGVPETVRIVGVVSSLGVADRDYPPEIYRPLAQSFPDSILLLAKLSSATEIPLSEIEQQIVTLANAAERDIPIYSFGYLTTEIETNNRAIGFFVSLFSAAALGALVLAVIGVYGLIARSVSARTAEIGIRRAIGSPNTKIAQMFLQQALSYLIIGVSVGGGLALIAINLIASTALSFNLFAAVSSVFLTVTLIVASLIAYASYAPVRKVVAIEPGEALHYQ